MKFTLIMCLMLLGAFVKAGEVPPGPDTNGDNGDDGDDGDGADVDDNVLNCLVGEVVNGEGAENVTLDACASGDVCQTYFESKVGFLSVVRECKQQQACMNNAGGNNPKCYPGENDVRLCHFCCNTDRCNDFVDIPDQE